VDDVKLFYNACNLTGDINGDNTVNIDDLLSVIANWGMCPGCPADVTGNGVVDIDDLLAVINHWT
jgi:hypothetical protein